MHCISINILCHSASFAETGASKDTYRAGDPEPAMLALGNEAPADAQMSAGSAGLKAGDSRLRAQKTT